MKSTTDRCSLRLCNLRHFPGYFEFSANKDNNNLLFYSPLVKQIQCILPDTTNQSRGAIGVMATVFRSAWRLLFPTKFAVLWKVPSVLVQLHPPSSGVWRCRKIGNYRENSGKLLENVGPKGARWFISNNKLHIAWKHVSMCNLFIFNRWLSTSVSEIKDYRHKESWIREFKGLAVPLKSALIFN